MHLDFKYLTYSYNSKVNYSELQYLKLLKNNEKGTLTPVVFKYLVYLEQKWNLTRKTDSSLTTKNGL